MDEPENTSEISNMEKSNEVESEEEPIASVNEEIVGAPILEEVEVDAEEKQDQPEIEEPSLDHRIGVDENETASPKVIDVEGEQELSNTIKSASETETGFEEKVSAAVVSNNASLESWQNKFLPYMIGMIALLSLFFLFASAIQLKTLHDKIWEGTQRDDTNPVFVIPPLEELESSHQVLAAHSYQALAELEQYTVQRRYHQANVLLMSRVWVRYLGFVTGMILAFVGSVFILGKMQEPPFEVDGEVSALRFTFAGTSPGILMVLVGVVLMVTTIVTHHEIKVNDAAFYVSTQSLRELNIVPSTNDDRNNPILMEDGNDPNLVACDELDGALNRLSDIILREYMGQDTLADTAEKTQIAVTLIKYSTGPNSETLDSCPKSVENAEKYVAFLESSSIDVKIDK